MNQQALFEYFSQAHGVALLQDDFDIIADNTKPEWISVEAYLPESTEDIVFENSFGHRFVGRYNYERFFDADSEIDYNVTRWLPLPESPKQ